MFDWSTLTNTVLDQTMEDLGHEHGHDWASQPRTGEINMAHLRRYRRVIIVRTNSLQ
jgi:hypothetical protein